MMGATRPTGNVKRREARTLAIQAVRAHRRGDEKEARLLGDEARTLDADAAAAILDGGGMTGEDKDAG